MTIRVLVIDDSALARDMICAALARAPDIEVIGTAADPLVARQHLATLRPDVLTLDVEMPHMDGIAFLEQVMRLHPLPVVMVSSLTAPGTASSLQALRLGAVAVVQKPSLTGSAFDALAAEIITRVRQAASVRLFRPGRRPSPVPLPPSAPGTAGQRPRQLVMVAGGTGCLPAVDFLLGCWPRQAPPLVLSLALPEVMPELLADALTRDLKRPVQVAHAGQPLETDSLTLLPAGSCIAGPGSLTGEGFQVCLTDSPGTGYQAAGHSLPAVFPAATAIDDVLVTAARGHGSRVIAVLLGGEAPLAARGMAAVAAAGGATVVQDRETALLCPWNTLPPGHGEDFFTSRQVPLPRLAEAILSLCQATVHAGS